MQRVEHGNLIYTVEIVLVGRRSPYAVIEGQRRKLYPTGNEHEPWTTNISHSK